VSASGRKTDVLEVSMTKKHIGVSMNSAWARRFLWGRLWQEQMLPHANQATSALYANLANALFVMIYAKLLISQVGTYFSWLESRTVTANSLPFSAASVRIRHTSIY
jgi:hypothetical protein